MKKFLTIAILSLMAITTKADYTLYWMASPWSASYWGAEAAALKGYDGEKYVQLQMIPLDMRANTNIGSGSNDQYTNFLVSLYKYDEDIHSFVEVAVSWEQYTYDQLIGSSYAYENKGAETQRAKDPLVFRSFVIPEPTSGLMLLLGLGALALKRKDA